MLLELYDRTIVSIQRLDDHINNMRFNYYEIIINNN